MYLLLHHLRPEDTFSFSSSINEVPEHLRLLCYQSPFALILQRDTWTIRMLARYQQLAKSIDSFLSYSASKEAPAVNLLGGGEQHFRNISALISFHNQLPAINMNQFSHESLFLITTANTLALLM